MNSINLLGVVGAGVIGAGWTVRALARGLEVVAWDPAQDTEARLTEAVAYAWPFVEKIGVYPGASPDRLTVVESVEALAGSVDFIQESAPERIELKIELKAHKPPQACPSRRALTHLPGFFPFVSR